MLRYAVFTALIFATLSKAADIDAPVKLAVAKGELSRLEITQVEGKPLLYKSSAADDELFVDELVSKGGKLRLILQGKKDGVYHIVFVRETEIVFTKIEVGTVAPKPVPVPVPVPVPPTPDPVPNPFSGKLKAYLITESEDKNINYSRIFSSKAVVDYWTSHNFIMPVIADPNVVDPATKKTPEKLKPYLKRAAGKADQLYLVDISTGKILYEGSAPQTDAELLKIVGEIK